MGIFIISETKFSYLNPGAVNIFSADSPEEILGKPVLEYVHQDFHAIFRKQVSTLIKQNKPILAVEERWLRLDGVPTELVVSAMPICFEKEPSALLFVQEKL